MDIVKPIVLDLLDNSKAPALSSTSDMPVVETKPDASPPETEKKAEAVPPSDEDGEAEQSGESATPATETPGQPAPRGVGKKIAELTKQREEERRSRIDAEERLNKALDALARATPQEAPKDDSEPVKPSKTDFPDPDAWDEALMKYADAKATWTARKEVQVLRDEEQKKAQEYAIAEAERLAREAYAKRIEKTKEKYPDFDEFAHSPDVKVSQFMADAIIQSEHGPDIQLYLGKHPEEAERIRAITDAQFTSVNALRSAVASQLVELGLIVGKINTPKVQAPVSNAPKPFKPLKGGDSAPSKGLSEMSMDEYAKARRSH